MIEYIRGILISFGDDYIVVENNNIGYKILSPSSSIQIFNNATDMITVYTELIVREDAMILCGFCSEFDRKVFNLLMSVSGVGMKLALVALSDMGAEQILFAISCGDDKSLTKISGVGKKTAQRMVLELKDKVDNVMDISVNNADISDIRPMDINSNYATAVEALLALGYTENECNSLLALIDKKTLETATVEDLITRALTNISKI